MEGAMNSLAAFAQRTEIVSKFRRGILIFWLPLIMAAVVPVLMIMINDVIEEAILLRWPIIGLLAFLLIIAVAWAVKKFQASKEEPTWGAAHKEHIIFATYFVLAGIGIFVLALSAIIAPRLRPEARIPIPVPVPPYQSTYPNIDRPDLDCKDCGGVDVDTMLVPKGSIPLPRPRPNSFRK
jgi:hypothetical protein